MKLRDIIDTLDATLICGTAHLEREMQTAGAVRQTLQNKLGDEYPDLIQRVYGRFRPSTVLRRALGEKQQEGFDE